MENVNWWFHHGKYLYEYLVTMETEFEISESRIRYTHVGRSTVSFNVILKLKINYAAKKSQKINLFFTISSWAYIFLIWLRFSSLLQNVLNTLGSILITSYLTSTCFCMLREDVSRSYLISALLLGAGICILILALCSVKWENFSLGVLVFRYLFTDEPNKSQDIFCRFVVTGSNRLGYLVCILMLFQTKHCQGSGDIYAMGPELRTAEWRHRLNELQGAVMITCGVQLLISLLGKALFT